MSRIDFLALILCLAIFIAGVFVSVQIYEGLPHIEDEIAFVWQARLIARGQLTIASPQPNPASFRVPFVVDFQGKRFAKYPPGWPAILAAGELFNIRVVINPWITAASFWLIYRLIKKIIDEPSALLAVVLGALSPFVLMNSATLLSHPWSLLLTTIFFLAWLDAFTKPNRSLPAKLVHRLPVLTGGLSLGLLALTRPWTAVGIAIPFVTHALYLLFRAEPATRLRLLGMALIAGVTASLYLLWQYSVTGDLWTNPYTLWWHYDKIGFGPGVGLYPDGYQIGNAKANTLFHLYAANTDLFGWPKISWLFMPFGLFAIRKNHRAWLLIFSMASLILAYGLYWTPSWIVGPRYYYEGLPAALLLTAVGIRCAAGYAVGSFRGIQWNSAGRFRFICVSFLTAFLIFANLFYYLPVRLAGLHGLYGISEECVQPFRALADDQARPTLVFVHLHKSFHEYSCSLDLNSPFLDSPLITAVSRGDTIDDQVAQEFSNRRVLHYYPDTQQFSSIPKNENDPGSEP